ncbi:MAG TPA: hypothetical protein VKY31_05180 [Terriglobia bacterium]|nr:hypothetical protein [Terriglobia bacterium]
MIERTVKAKALVFAIFMLGIGTGLFVSYIYTTRVAALSAAAPNTPDRTQRAQRDVNKFYDYLGLNQEQRDQMRKIGEETRREFQDLRKETQPRYEAIQDASRAKIRSVLNDEQRQKYDDFRKRMDERRKARERDLNKNSNGDKDRNPNSDRGTK